MSRRFPESAIKRLEDAIPGVSDDEVNDLLSQIAEDFRMAKKPRGAKKTPVLRCDRATALANVCRAEAELDPTVVRFRQVPLETRQKLLLAILTEARRAFADLAIHGNTTVGEPSLTLPGVVVGSREQFVSFPVNRMRIMDQRLLALVTWSVAESSRIASTYAIKTEFAVLFLYLYEGFSPRPTFTWSIEKRTDYSGLTRLRLDIDPHLSPEEVANAYAEAKRMAGFGNRRAQRDKTYGLATLCAGLVGIVDWRIMLVIWDGKCWENGFHDWIYNPSNQPPSDAIVYQFTRDAKYAISSLLHR
jgi:hypothetical protein